MGNNEPAVEGGLRRGSRGEGWKTANWVACMVVEDRSFDGNNAGWGGVEVNGS